MKNVLCFLEMCGDKYIVIDIIKMEAQFKATPLYNNVHHVSSLSKTTTKEIHQGFYFSIYVNSH